MVTLQSTEPKGGKAALNSESDPCDAVNTAPLTRAWLLVAIPFQRLSADSVPVHSYTLAASFSVAWPLVPISAQPSAVWSQKPHLKPPSKPLKDASTIIELGRTNGHAREEDAVRGQGCSIMSKQAGTERPGQGGGCGECVTCTPVHYERIVRDPLRGGVPASEGDGDGCVRAAEVHNRVAGPSSPSSPELHGIVCRGEQYLPTTAPCSAELPAP
jgi:hypothetical protein